MSYQTEYLNLVLAIAGSALGSLALWQNRQINKLRQTFFSGKSGADLEAIILNLKQELSANQQQLMSLEQELSATKITLGFAVQRVGMVRFNPFEGSGGNFSFSLALLDSHNNGVVITSMYGREQNRIYAKGIKQGHSEFQLTEEEIKALAAARQKELAAVASKKSITK